MDPKLLAKQKSLTTKIPNFQEKVRIHMKQKYM